jgi:hypothetical protein
MKEITVTLSAEVYKSIFPFNEETGEVDKAGCLNGLQRLKIIENLNNENGNFTLPENSVFLKTEIEALSQRDIQADFGSPIVGMTQIIMKKEGWSVKQVSLKVKKISKSDDGSFDMTLVSGIQSVYTVSDEGDKINPLQIKKNKDKSTTDPLVSATLQFNLKVNTDNIDVKLQSVEMKIANPNVFGIKTFFDLIVSGELKDENYTSLARLFKSHKRDLKQEIFDYIKGLKEEEAKKYFNSALTKGTGLYKLGSVQRGCCKPTFGSGFFGKCSKELVSDVRSNSCCSCNPRKQ